MQDQQEQEFIPAWQRVMDLPELCDMLQAHLSQNDLAVCCRVSQAFHSLWSPRLWNAISTGRLSPFPSTFERNGHLVRQWLGIVLRYGRHQEAMDSARVYCTHLEVLELRLIEFRWQTFLKHFMGLRQKTMQQIEARSTEGHPFIPGRTGFFRNGSQDGFHLIPRRQPNAFLSSTLRKISFSLPYNSALVLMPWMTRAALEGHLQGLVVFQLNDIPTGWSGHSDPLDVSWEVLYQFLESCPCIGEFLALQLRIVPDEPGPRINSDILDAADNPRSLLISQRQSQPIGLYKLALHSTEPDFSKEDANLTRLLSRLPHLVHLCFQEESIQKIATALEKKPKWDTSIGGLSIKENTQIRYFSMNAYTRPDMSTLSGWRQLGSCPALCLETLDLLSREDVPGDFLDIIATSPSIMSLKHLRMNKTRQCSGEVVVNYRSIQRFFRSAPSLEEVQVPFTYYVMNDFFTAEESAQWPCRDRVKILKFGHIDLFSSVVDSTNLRLWLWSFKQVEVVEITGINATVDAFVDPMLTPWNSLPLQLDRLELPYGPQKVTLAQIKYVVEQVMPKLSYLQVFMFEEDAANWLRENHPAIKDYISEALFGGNT
ncbi:hypothetical protein EMPS_07119 [Entomortierella parvispora]|uniref:F-box domain-containing protein n=1 Tax=Entomortierella parvispora TaxID=205924 RepID=A0A9P3HDU2_9FUNG|nr:hypothetical protein EMPS_07119 [Entomortierella parvispora]